ncbi:MAG: amidohydrolase [Treponema sp.]|jgi:aminobenzoyl-glutamate utilization protein B|nr:amidohydrolase [Treponema sp.]
MDIKEIKRFAREWALKNSETYYRTAKFIWENPELSMQEFKSAGALCKVLADEGFQIEKGAGGMPTAFIASYGSGKPVIGINCEYDALPGLSQSAERPVKKPLAEGAPGHGCGHNLLGTGGVKAAAALRNSIEKFGLSGTIKVIGAPAEELCLGKPFLAKAGAFAGIDAFLDWHPWFSNNAGYFDCPAYFSVKYHYRGRLAHGNSPWYGRSALDAAMLQAQASEFLREHINPGNPPYAANTFNYTFSNTGPEFPSVVPDRASIWYVGRFVTTGDAQEALRRITNCAKGAALATETEVETELITATNHRIPNKVLAECMYANFEELGPPEFTAEEQQTAKEIQKELGVPETGLTVDLMPLTGGYAPVSDISEYSWNAPHVAVSVAMAPDNVGWHHWSITFTASNSIGGKGMDKAADIIAATGIDLLCDPSIISRAKAELKERLEGKDYQCLLPAGAKPPVNLNADIMAKYPAR